MLDRKKAIAIIPARGGSKRIPRKNIKDFCGRPILAYSIQAAKESGVFDEIMVSTDDDEIANIAVQYGASVPFMRSAELSTDMAMTAPVLIEVLCRYKDKNLEFDYTCCIYPTAPLIQSKLLQVGMQLLANERIDCVLPVVKFSYPPQRCLIIKNNRASMLHPENYNVRSQDLEPLFHDCGQFYCLNSKSLLEQQKLFCIDTIPLEIPERFVQDIDNEEDWKIAEIKYRILKNVQ